MKIKEGFLLKEIDDTGIVVATGKASKKFNNVITLNQTGILLWKKLSEGCEKDELVKALTDIYDIDEFSADRDVEAFLQNAKDANVIE